MKHNVVYKQNASKFAQIYLPNPQFPSTQHPRLHFCPPSSLPLKLKTPKRKKLYLAAKKSKTEKFHYTTTKKRKTTKTGRNLEQPNDTSDTQFQRLNLELRFLLRNQNENNPQLEIYNKQPQKKKCRTERWNR